MRRRRRTTETTQLEILAAAEQLFAQRGFADVSLSQIAERANVAKSLIHHHFGSKEELWSHIKRRHLRDYSALRNRLLSENGTGSASIGHAIREYFEFLSSRPLMVRIFGWMMQESTEGEYVQAGGDVIRLAASSLQRAQAAGKMRDNIKPVFAVLTFISATEHWLRMREQFAPALLDETDLRVADESFLGSLTELMAHGMEPIAASPIPTPLR